MATFKPISDEEIEPGAPISNALMIKIRDSLDALNEGVAATIRGWWLTIGDYDLKAFSVSSEDSNPTGVTFNANGTKIYVIGDTSDKIYQYTLAIEWDVSSASFDSVSFDVSSQTTVPQALLFSSDGMALFVLSGGSGGGLPDKVFQYTLGTAWDITTATYASKNFDVSAQVPLPHGFAFSIDGTKMYVLGEFAGSVYQYTLSTAWDVSTASYASKSLSISGVAPDCTGIGFDSAGKRVFVISPSTDAVHEYWLPTPCDISTGIYLGVAFSVAALETSPADLAFSSAGEFLYVIGSGGQSVYQYRVSARV